MANSIITFLALVAVASVTAATVSNFQPKNGFEYVGTAAGRIFVAPILTGSEENGISWQSALERCTSSGYRMALVDSKEVEDVIAKYITAGGSRKWSWIDGTNFISSDNFFSVHTGQNLTYFNWAWYGLPVGDAKSRCLRWSYNSMDQGMWDVACDYDKNSVICETPAS